MPREGKAGRPLQIVLDRLEALGCSPRRVGSGWIARCPAHEDKHPSLSVSEGSDGRPLIYCHAGCGIEAITMALGLALKDLFEAKPDHCVPRPLAA